MRARPARPTCPIAPLALLLAAGCARDKSASELDSGERPGETDSAADSGETWLSLSASCEAPSPLPDDPLTLQGANRVGQTDGSPFMEAIDVERRGDLVFAVGQGGLTIFDASDPAAVARVYGPWESGRGKLHRVEPLGEGLVATSQRDEGVMIWDVSDPASATVIGAIGGSGMEGLSYTEASGAPLLFVTVRDEGLRVYDLSDPAAPALAASASGLRAPWELAATGDGWLYAADNTLGVVPIDVRDAAAPVIGAPLAMSGPTLHVAYAEDRVYAALGGDGVGIVDVSARDAPRLLDTVLTGGSAVMSDVAEGRLWVADHEGIAVLDLSTDPPTPIQRQDVEQFALAIDADGDRAFVGDWNLLEIWGLADGAAGAIDLASDTLRIADGAASATITNRGSGALTLSGATVSDSGALVEVSATALAPGEAASLRVTGLSGDATLCLASDDPDDPLLSLDLLQSAAPPAGEPAPDFALTDLSGETHRLSEQLGHPVLLAYFATW